MNFIKKYWFVFVLLVGTLFLFGGDTSYLCLQIGSLSAAALVLVGSNIMLDDRAEWGLFPYICLSELVEKAKEHAIGAAIVVASVFYLIGAVIQAVVVR